MVEPLTRCQKTFNQLLLAEHCMTEKRARKLWENIVHNENNGSSIINETGGETFEDSISSSNEQLRYSGLEIVAISMANQGSSQSSGRYYAIINKDAEPIAKNCFKTLFPSNQIAYVRLVMEKLVDKEGGAVSRSTLINHRTDLPDPHKLGIDAAETVLEKLLEQKWLMFANDENENRRQSNSAKLTLAPRAYMELSYLLIEEFGMDRDDLPQQIYYRV